MGRGTKEITMASEKKPAVFIDRDGTLIEFEGQPTAAEHIRLFPFSAEAVRRLNEKGYLVIVITNQPIIGKGIITLEHSNDLNDYMRNELQKAGARIDAVYTCPHTYDPDNLCRCRKPAIGMIEEASDDFEIDLQSSWLVGDTTRDMETGKNAGLKSILVKTGEGGSKTEFFQAMGDYQVENLLAAVDLIEKTAS